MVSCDTLSTISNFTNRSCRSRNVHRSYPSGASPQANAIKCASACPSSWCSYSRSVFFRFSAFSNPPSLKALRILVTVTVFTQRRHKWPHMSHLANLHYNPFLTEFWPFLVFAREHYQRKPVFQDTLALRCWGKRNTFGTFAFSLREFSLKGQIPCQMWFSVLTYH